MASISNDPNGRRRIQFVAPDKARKSIRLGKVSKRDAESIKFRVEQLLASKITGNAVDSDTAQWVAALPTPLAAKLAKAGLTARPEDKAEATLGPFLTDYVDRRTDVKPATKEVWSQVTRNLLEHFGEDRDLATITEGDAENFKLYLIGEKLASTTVHKRLGFARQFLGMARKHRLIDTNPFAEVKSQAAIQPDRQHFVGREEIEHLLTVCNPTWRLIVGLARFGGLHCPSEVLSLKWEGVNWATGRIVVESPKTEHHPGKGSRVIPLFPELRPILEEAFELADTGAEYVVGGGYRQAALTSSGWRNCNLRTQFERLVKRAGLSPWPRLFHALRASRETELAQDHPLHVVTSWLGNSPRIALKHYLQVTDADFERASQGGAESGARAAHFQAQHAHAGSRQKTQESGATPGERAAFATSCDTQLVATKALNGEDRIRTCGGVAPSRI